MSVCTYEQIFYFAFNFIITNEQMVLISKKFLAIHYDNVLLMVKIAQLALAPIAPLAPIPQLVPNRSYIGV